MSAVLEAMKKSVHEELRKAANLKELDEIKVKYLSKKSELNKLMKTVGTLPPEERKTFGQHLNVLKEEIATTLKEKQEEIEKGLLEQQIADEEIDVTLPSYPVMTGSRHLLDEVVETIEDIFLSMGYTVAEGPEVENDFYNFEALNIPKNHPARDMQDSFYITEELLLRTHTSPVQARTLQNAKKNESIKILCPGKVFRRDEDDATHSHQFMQIEGLVVGENVSLSDLKGTLDLFAKKFFGEDRTIRLRPSYFPFTEPSVEVDVSCAICHGKGCRTCKQTGWIEVLGAGMVHPNVLKSGGFDSEKMSGFAFGMGVERLAMLKYGIDDIRHFYTNDVRFLKQRLGQ
jgi:phenylalanyl-tRNA synthetase alpha chain